jgi:hypothetical protein
VWGSSLTRELVQFGLLLEGRAMLAPPPKQRHQPDLRAFHLADLLGERLALLHRVGRCLDPVELALRPGHGGVSTRGA